ncbi:MAG: transporter [Myxococcales bacterium]|nr:transporter [Myxococcales bacterium]
MAGLRFAVTLHMGGAAPVASLQSAAMAVNSGAADYVLIPAGWNSYSGPRAQETVVEEMAAMPGGAIARDYYVPYGLIAPAQWYSLIARRHMHEFGTTPEQLGAIAVACRRHANLTPSAIMRSKTLTLEDYLSRPMLVDPLRVEDCCLISDGGAAYVMSSLERARDLAQPPIVVAGVGEGYSDSGTHWSQQRAFTSTPQVFSAPPAFAMAGLEPKDVDVLTLYDPFTIVALMQIEDMGFCKKGEAGAFVEGRTLHHDGGVLPYNTHGGLLSHAYVLGIAHVVEVVRQLRGQAAAQVPGARVGVYGGYTGHMATTLILRRL